MNPMTPKPQNPKTPLIFDIIELMDIMDIDPQQNIRNFFQNFKMDQQKWNETMKDVRVSKQDINRMVMNYLVVEGYKSAAENFAQESGVEANMDFDLIDQRREIRILLQEGKIQEAIEKINDLNPEILDTNDVLYFQLKKQRLIELIKDEQIEQALLFCQKHLAEKSAKKSEFMEQLEEVMTLL